jgi:hypothetical protein
VYQVVFLAMAVEVNILRSSTVPCRLGCDAITLAFDYLMAARDERHSRIEDSLQ